MHVSRVNTDINRFMVLSYCITECIASLVNVPGPLNPDKHIKRSPLFS